VGSRREEERKTEKEQQQEAGLEIRRKRERCDGWKCVNECIFKRKLKRSWSTWLTSNTAPQSASSRAGPSGRATIDAQGREGLTALHLAAPPPSYPDNIVCGEMIELLFRSGVNTNIRDVHGRTGLDIWNQGCTTTPTIQPA
jgi:hypothetical protein